MAELDFSGGLGTEVAARGGTMTDASPAAVPAPPDFSAGLRDTHRPGNYFTDLARLAVHGLTMGFSDEMLAGAGALMDSTSSGRSFSQSYQDRVAEERFALQSARDNAGWAGTAAEIAGGLVIPGGALARAGSGVGTRLAAKVIGERAAAAPIVGQMTGGAALGAGFGAANAVGNADPNPNATTGDALRQRFAEGLGGVATGAAVGAVLPPALRASGYLVSPVTNLLNSAVSPAATAENRVLAAIGRNGQSAAGAGGEMRMQQAATKQFTSANPSGQGTASPYALMDTGMSLMGDAGKNAMQRAARTVQTIPGEGSARVEAFLKARQLDQPERVTSHISNALADPETFYKTADKIASERSSAAGPLYEQAFTENPIINTAPVLKKLIDALETSAGQTRAALQSVGKELTTIASATDGTMQTVNAVKVGLKSAHGVKMMMDDLIGAAVRQGENAKAGQLLGVKKAIVEEMDRVSPTYAKARDIYAGQSDLMNALESGAGAINSAPEAVSRELAGLTKSERDMWRIGLARALRDKLDNAPDGADVVKRVFGNPRMRGVLESAMEDKGTFARFERAMQIESRMVETNQMVRGGSQTANKLAEVAEGAPDFTVLGHLMHGQPLAALGHAAGGVLNRMSGLTPAVGKEMANILTSSDPAVVERLIRRSAKNAASGARAESGRQAITRAIATHPESIPD